MNEEKYNGYETPQWELTGTQPEDGSYEVRRYPAAHWTSTEEQRPSVDAPSSNSFWRLFNYIRGDNSTKEKIDMTVPVIQQVSGQSCPFSDTTYKMMFYVPPKHQSSPPDPCNPDVKTEKMEETTAYVRTFSGRPKGRDFQKEAGNLYESLKKNSVDVSNIDMNIFYAVTYDSPFRLFFRRNEVWLLPKKKESEETKQAAQGNEMEQQAE
ncbi:heme-binding protein 2-like [Clavelina lepadiformis]|uniref:heme-binding protein 2-like n=1 Tax=Clavelina lepadiformis TaxID=159417 RepID=UPI00404250E1